MPEAIVLYYDVIQARSVDDDDESDDDPRSPCWENLIKQCKEYETPFIVIGGMGASTSLFSAQSTVVAYEPESSPPSPKELLRAIESVVIQPDSFGGSSGFGRVQSVEPMRHPMPSRTVVFGSTVDHSRAARCAGMRVVSVVLPPTSETTDKGDDDHLADAVMELDEVRDLWLEDVATPGSYWLNPPHPRDDEGNRVDPEAIVVADRYYNSENENNESNNAEASTTSPPTPSSASTQKEDVDEMDDEEMKRILADLSPL